MADFKVISWMIVVNTSHGEEKSLFCPEERGSNFFSRKVKKTGARIYGFITQMIVHLNIPGRMCPKNRDSRICVEELKNTTRNLI